jgi:polyphosphate kinase
MEKRVEILFPVFAENFKKRLMHLLTMELSDNVKAREQDNKGEYHYVKLKSTDPQINCQYKFIELARISEDDCHSQDK